MPSYQSSKFRAGTASSEAKQRDGVDPQLQQLQEMFPSWSEEDLKSLLLEVNNDYELAAARISEGHAEQWGSVPRKKEKRIPAGGAPSRDSAGGRDKDRERGESRGGRGGRGGGRGGRGGGLRGAGRGGHRETNGRHTPSTPAAGDASKSNAWAQDASESTKEGAASGTEGLGNGAATGAPGEGWGDLGATKKEESSASGEAVSTPAPAEAAPAKATPSAWVNGAAAAKSVEKKPQTPAPVSAPVVAAPIAKPATPKTPAVGKMSWAQIARPQEKPKPAPAPAPAPVVPSPVPAVPEPAPVSVVESESQPQAQPESQGWEEPTTAQAPIWDDEPPQNQETQPATTLPITEDGWITSPPPVPQPTLVKTEDPPAPPPSKVETDTVASLAPVAAPSAFPAQLNLQQHVSPIVSSAKPATPVGGLRGGLPRSTNRFKTTDQAVVMPSAFSASVEKLGMQFGSVGLSSDDLDSASEPPTESHGVPDPPTPVAESAPVQKPAVQKPATPEPPAAPVQVPLQPPALSQTSISTQSLFQQALPQQIQQVPQSVHSASQSSQQTPPSLLSTQTVSHSSISSQAATSTAASSPLTGFSTQQTTPSQSSISPYQQHISHQQQQTTPASQTQAPAQSQIQPQTQSQLHQQYSHFPSHLEQSLNSQSTQQSAQQQSALHQGISGHTSYFRQPSTEYFHTPTPPAGQTQEPSYSSFNPLNQQLGHQTQASHLAGFGGDHFSYNDAQRGFYDSYGQQQSFSGRNNIGHDDMSKVLSGPQQPSQASSVPQATSQPGSQQPQTGSQPQAPSTGQPQQGYASAAPLPYYYNPYQSPQYYGAPYGSTYGMAGQYATGRFQPQQPPMFPPNVNPTSAASPANAKGPSGVGAQPGIQAGLQPQSNPYAAQGLYGQQHASSAYDDGYGSHHSQLGHQQGVGGLPSSEYGKQLYGQGIQSFMGMSQGAGSASAAPLGQRGSSAGGTGSSPENSYKPYGGSGAGIGVGAKDVNGPGVSGSIAGGQGALGGQASRAGIQQPLAQHQHSQGFYGANRFSANQSSAGPPSQQGQQQQQSGQGYGAPQSGADANFYYQRAPSQQQYWQ